MKARYPPSVGIGHSWYHVIMKRQSQAEQDITFMHYLEWLETTHAMDPDQVPPLTSAVIMFNAWIHARYHIRREVDHDTMQSWMDEYRFIHGITDQAMKDAWDELRVPDSK